MRPLRLTPALLLAAVVALTACGNQPTGRGKPVQPAERATPGTTQETPRPIPSPTARAAATPVPPTQAPATPGARPQTSDKIEAVLARGATDSYEAKNPTTQFPEDAEKIWLVVKSVKAEDTRVGATWIAVNVEGYDAHRKLNETSVNVGAGQRGAIWLEPPKGGFLPGDYRVDVQVNGEQALSLPFNVTPILPPATVITPSDQPRTFNLALAGLGGKIESATSEYNTTDWAVRNVNNGTPAAWSSKGDPPQELVFSFHQGREAQIAAVAIDRAEIKSKMLRTPQHVMVSAWQEANDPKIWRQDKIEVPVLAVYSPMWTSRGEGFIRGISTRPVPRTSGDWAFLDDGEAERVQPDPDGILVQAQVLTSIGRT